MTEQKQLIQIKTYNKHTFKHLFFLPEYNMFFTLHPRPVDYTLTVYKDCHGSFIKTYDDEGKLTRLCISKLEKLYDFKYDYNRVNTDDEDIEENL